MRPWDSIISDEEQRAYHAAGFGRPSGLGTRPATVVVRSHSSARPVEPPPLEGAPLTVPLDEVRVQVELMALDAQRRGDGEAEALARVGHAERGVEMRVHQRQIALRALISKPRHQRGTSHRPTGTSDRPGGMLGCSGVGSP